MKQEDPLTAKAGELRAASEKFQAELDQFQATSKRSSMRIPSCSTATCSSSVTWATSVWAHQC